MTSVDRTSSLARLQPLTTHCDDEYAHKRRRQARRQSIKGGCSPSDPASFTTDNRTNEHILTRTALHLGSETLKLFLCIFSLPKKYNQTTLSLPVHSYPLSTRSPHTPNIRRRRCLWTSTFTTGTRFTAPRNGTDISYHGRAPNHRYLDMGSGHARGREIADAPLAIVGFGHRP